MSEKIFLKPGLYLRHGTDMWCRAGNSAPSHTLRTKGFRHGGWLLRVFQSLTSWFVRLPGSGGTAEVVLTAFDGGSVVLDLSAGVVRRRYGAGPVSAEYIDWRKKFSRHVTAPSFEVSADRETVMEELVEGDYLLDVDIQTRTTSLHQLLLQYAALTRSEGIDASHSIGSELQRAFSQARLPESFVAAYSCCDRNWLGGSVIVVPSAFEATAKNLLISRDGKPTPIDLGDLRLEPFFAYPIGVITSAGSEVIECFFNGDFDAALEELFVGAGHTWDSQLRTRTGLLLERMAYGALCDARGSHGVEIEVFEKSLIRRWSELSPSLKQIINGMNR